METIGTRAAVLKALQESKNPMSLRDVIAASGLRRTVCTGALYRLRDIGCVEVSISQGGFAQFKATGKPDTARTRVLREGRKRPRRQKEADDRGVEMFVRVLDKDGNLIELSLQQALEVERQLKTLRASMMPPDDK